MNTSPKRLAALVVSIPCLMVLIGLLAPVAATGLWYCGTRYTFSTVCAAQFAGPKLRRRYDQINKYLEDHVEDDDPTKNTAAIDAKIAIESKGNNRELLEALNLFRELSLENSPSLLCTRSTYNMLLANDRAMNNIMSKVNKGEKPTRRIERLLLHYALEHSRECGELYLKLYKENIAKMEPEDLERARKFIGNLIKRKVRRNVRMLKHLQVADADQFLRERPVEASEFVGKIRSFASKRGIKAAYWSLVEFARAEEHNHVLSKMDGRASLTDTVSLGLLISSHLTKPCEIFEEKLGGAFGSNLSVLRSADLKPDDEDKRQFFRDQTIFKGCLVFLKDSLKVANEIKKMLQGKKKFKY